MEEENKSSIDSAKLLLDSMKETRRSNKIKDKIIILLIVLLFLEPVIMFAGFYLYESQYEYVETYTEETVTTTTDDSDITLSTEGENANAEYNNVEGDQYNDNSTHNEGGVE